MTRAGNDTVAITGVGMVASLGYDVITNCAAARAGISRAAELRVLNFAGDEVWGNEPVVGYTTGQLAEGFVGTGKLMQLARPALHDLGERARLQPEEASHTGLFVNFSDRYFERAKARDEYESRGGSIPSTHDVAFQEEQAERVALVQRLAKWRGLSEVHQKTYHGGHTGIVDALHDAVEGIASGVMQRCVVGGIESCVDPAVLTASVACGVLKTAANPDGFMPGEAAAFILIESTRSAQGRDVMPCGIVDGLVKSQEAYHRLDQDSPLGQALARAIVRSLGTSRAGGDAVGFVMGDLNGDSFRAKEWGNALVRLSGQWNLGNLPLWLPALSFGEIGASTGAVAICMGVRALQRGYAPADRALGWLVGDDGSRGAFCLRKYH